MSALPRVAFFADCFYEVNGVALTCRRFDGFARSRNYPLLSIHAGPQQRSWTDGPVETLELDRGPLSFALEADLWFDLTLLRHLRAIRARVERFRPDLIHLTGPGDIGILGAVVAHQLQVPIVASWHTNIHEFGGRRLEKLLSFLPGGFVKGLANAAERAVLACALRYYKMAAATLAPNPELVSLLQTRTGKPSFPMPRGVDTDLYRPRPECHENGIFSFGYVGRLSPEKNVRALVSIERKLMAAGAKGFRFLVVGHGSELEWLKANLRSGVFPGVLKGQALAEAYSSMDAFVFPSETDTFGNVILEALASGLPALVTQGGGPKFIIEHGVSGWAAQNVEEMASAALLLMRDSALHLRMQSEARARAMARSWDRVFDDLYDVYRFACGLPPHDAGSFHRSHQAA